MEKDAVRKQVHAALEREHRINLHRYPVRIGAADVVDRLRVAPGERSRRPSTRAAAST